MKFSLALYPWIYIARYTETETWTEEFREQKHKTPNEEAALSEQEYMHLLLQRNCFADMPLVNYTTQYGLSCFEGLKAFPQPDGSVKLFRPQANALRMYQSMQGLSMPSFPTEMFIKSVKGVVQRNIQAGFSLPYNSEWEKEHFLTAESIYIRPFSYSEHGIGLNLCQNPFVIVVTTPVGSYFDTKATHKAITTQKIRATAGGTGWIKCTANYVIPILVKHEVQNNGFMEAIFLDAKEQKYVEEGTSSNIFFFTTDGILLTPRLEDTILPGITRSSVIQLAQDRGITVTERRITIDEVMSETVEAFVTGTAAGISYIESITHNGQEKVFCNRKIGNITRELLYELKGLQYGAVEDKHQWMLKV